MTVYRRNGVVVAVDYENLSVGEKRHDDLAESIRPPVCHLFVMYYVERLMQSGSTSSCLTPST